MGSIRKIIYRYKTYMITRLKNQSKNKRNNKHDKKYRIWGYNYICVNNNNCYGYCIKNRSIKKHHNGELNK